MATENELWTLITYAEEVITLRKRVAFLEEQISVLKEENARLKGGGGEQADEKSGAEPG